MSDFSQTNYLTFAQRVSQGYINLDNSQYNFNLAKYLSTANSWKIVLNVDVESLTPTGSNTTMTLISDNWSSYWVTNVYIGKTGVWGAGFSKESTNYYSIGSVANSSVLAEVGKNYYVSTEFSGTYYRLGVSTDGINYEYGNLLNTTEKLGRSTAVWAIGRRVNDSKSDPFLGTVYLDKSYIEINGEIAWKGAEKL